MMTPVEVPTAVSLSVVMAEFLNMYFNNNTAPGAVNDISMDITMPAVTALCLAA